ncbi:MAG TPA: secretin and TonB N-terminal domain-containing protein, partial [Caulobacteraceae bacterium]|nr:secretin and TonB N-terminal domain-containing protein [Caulobacteraceae bacterium]
MKTWTRLLFCATALTTAAVAAPALAAELDETVTFNIAPGSLDEALIAYSDQADLQVISASSSVRGKRTDGVKGDATPRQALALLLKDSGLSYVATSPTTVTVSGESRPQSGSAAGGGAEVEALIVTAQKREEDIQDVPIAISAFTQEALEAQKIEGGFDLLKAIPNVT